jgi:hypothetical protein
MMKSMIRVGSGDKRTVVCLGEPLFLIRYMCVCACVRMWGECAYGLYMGDENCCLMPPSRIWRRPNGHFPVNPIGIAVLIVVAFFDCGYPMSFARPPASRSLLQVQHPSRNFVRISSQLSEQFFLPLGSAVPAFLTHNPSMRTVVSIDVLRHINCDAWESTVVLHNPFPGDPSAHAHGHTHISKEGEEIQQDEKADRVRPSAPDVDP